MKLDRKEILKALETITIAGEGKNMVESGAVQNVITFGDEVVVDLLISTPAMHIKKRAEDDIKKLIHEQFSPDAVVKVNIKVEAKENPNEIKGKSIPGIDFPFISFGFSLASTLIFTFTTASGENCS